MNTRLMLTLAASLSLVAGAAGAHDFFLVPERFIGPAGQPLIVHATSSSDFPALNVGSPLTRVGEARATVNGKPARVAVDAQRQSLRLTVSSVEEGMAAVTLQTVWGESNWRPDQVETYLEEHPFAAEDIATVHRLLPAGATLQIRSRRLAKSLVCFETCTPSAQGPTGLEVEFLPQFEPGRASPVAVQLVRNGQPLAAHPVVVRFGADERRSLVTDAEGRLQLEDDLSGPVMLVAVTIDAPSQPGDRFVANNATLTFEASAHGRGAAH